MKTLSKTLILAIILSATMFGCSKKSDNGTKPVTATTWTISGTTYKGTFTGFTSNELLAVDNNATNDPDIGIQFNGTPAAGTYTVVDQVTGSSNLSSTQCYIVTTDGSGNNTLYSEGGGTVTITVNGGLITAKFSNINMGTLTGIDNNGNPVFTAAGTSSGTLIEQQPS